VSAFRPTLYTYLGPWTERYRRRGWRPRAEHQTSSSSANTTVTTFTWDSASKTSRGCTGVRVLTRGLATLPKVKTGAFNGQIQRLKTPKRTSCWCNAFVHVAVVRCLEVCIGWAKRCVERDFLSLLSIYHRILLSVSAVNYCLLSGISYDVYFVLYFHVCYLVYFSLPSDWLKLKAPLITVLTCWGYYLNEDHVEECVFVYFFFLFVFILGFACPRP